MKTKTNTNKIRTEIFHLGTIALFVFALLSLLLSSCNTSDTDNNVINCTISAQEKPWTRWWWMGNALNKPDITYQMEEFANAGLGGVEITPIYGTKGYESQFIDYLSPKWLEMLEYTISEGERLGMKVDMVMGTGWPFGGPMVEPEFAASTIIIQKYKVDSGTTLTKKIEIDDIKQKELAQLLSVFYFDVNNNRIDLTPLLVENKLTFSSKNDQIIYALFCGKTGQQVKRSAPGGAGYTLDHFSKEAFTDYSNAFETALQPFQNRLRSIFNDSYEVYGANFSPHFLDDFKHYRKYDLLDYIPLLDEKPDTEEYHRLLCDYRETMGDMLLNNFAKNWHQWSKTNTFKTKYQAHGSPGNLIDLYGAADIPECEVFGSPKFDIPGYRRDTSNIRKGDSNKMMLKFCSSAAHLNGSELVSSESFTWLREHFKTALSHCKPVADDLLLSGVTHMFLHGSTYSPKDDVWPGFKFYASVNFNPTNTIWHDAPALFSYIARCQSILQKAKTDNEVLIYWPVYDALTHANPKRLLHQFTIHSIDEWMLETSYYNIATQLDSAGIGFDFLSDQYLQNIKVNKGLLNIGETSNYKTIIVPDTEIMPIKTLNKLIELKSKGASIIFIGLPETVPGLHNYKKREEELTQTIADNKSIIEPVNSLFKSLNEIGIEAETANSFGLKILRKSIKGNKLYFVANHSAMQVDTLIPFNFVSQNVQLFDPMSGKHGLAKTKTVKSKTFIKLQLQPGQSAFIISEPGHEKQNWTYLNKEVYNQPITNRWEIKFLEGGSKQPNDTIISSLQSWTNFGGEYENFSGTARYSSTFELKKNETLNYILHLGDVRESARVKINDKDAGTVFSIPFNLNVTNLMINGENKIEIDVTNLSANRLRALEQTGYEWKRFYEINMVNIHYQPLNAAEWQLSPSGLCSEIQLSAYSIE